MYLPLNRFASPTGGLSGFLLKVYSGKVQIIFACSAGSDLSYNLYSCYNIHCIKLFSIQYFKKTFQSGSYNIALAPCKKRSLLDQIEEESALTNSMSLNFFPRLEISYYKV